MPRGGARRGGAKADAKKSATGAQAQESQSVAAPPPAAAPQKADAKFSPAVAKPKADAKADAKAGATQTPIKASAPTEDGAKRWSTLARTLLEAEAPKADAAAATKPAVKPQNVRERQWETMTKFLVEQAEARENAPVEAPAATPAAMPAATPGSPAEAAEPQQGSAGVARWADLSESIVQASAAEAQAAAAQAAAKTAAEAAKWAAMTGSLAETSTAEAKAAAAQAAEKVAEEAEKWAKVSGSLVQASTAEAKVAAAQVAEKVVAEAQQWAKMSGSLVEASAKEGKVEAVQAAEKMVGEADKWAKVSESLVQASTVEAKAAAAQVAEKVAGEAKQWAKMSESLVQTSAEGVKAEAVQVAEKMAGEAGKWAKVSESLVQADAKARPSVDESPKALAVGGSAKPMATPAPAAVPQAAAKPLPAPTADPNPGAGVLTRDIAAVPIAAAQARPAASAPPALPPGRIDFVDGCCFALVLPIILAHAARFNSTNKTLLNMLTQENVLVGGFFSIMGYIAAYTSTRLGERAVDERKLAKPELFFWSRVMSYYPLHFVVSTVFAPMFVAVDRWYGLPWKTTAFRAFLNYSLLQAWFPKQTEAWNQPSWFLSALTTSNLAMPIVLRRTATLGKAGLRNVFKVLATVSVLQKLAYSNTSRFRTHNITATGSEYPLIWNMTRFHPFWSLLEMVMGVVAARDVMLDTAEDRARLEDPLAWFAAAHAPLLLRATHFDLNDGLVRSAIFVPLYTRFLMALHRDSRSQSPSLITRLLRSAPITGLGSLTFSVFLLHAPIGQLFYKKAVATRLWGAPLRQNSFPLYLVTVFLASFLVNECVIKSDTVQRAAAGAARWLALRTEGVLQDRA